MKWFSLLYSGDIHTATDSKVIPKEAFSELLEGKEVVEKAKKDAAKKKKETKELCEQLKREAQEEGYQDGLVQFNEAILKHSDEMKALRLELQKMVIPIALKAAKRIVGKELKTFPETIVDIVLQTIHPVNESREVTIYVCPGDKELLEKEKPKIQEVLQHATLFRIEEKKDLAPGDCIIKTEGGMINATQENQWRAMEQAFAKYR